MEMTGGGRISPTGGKTGHTHYAPDLPGAGVFTADSADPVITVTQAGSGPSIHAIGRLLVERIGVPHQYAEVLVSGGESILQAVQTVLTLTGLGSIRFNVSGSEKARIDSSGRLGIGTTSPDQKLTIVSGGDAQISLKNSGGTTKAYIGTSGAFGSAGTDDLRIRSDGAAIVFGFNGSEYMRLSSAGLLTGAGTSFGAWTSYTPTWSTPGTPPSLGNGTIFGRYCLVGKTCHFYIRLILGSTSTVGTGGWLFTLPKADAGLESQLLITGNAIDVSTGLRYPIAHERSSSTVFYALHGSSPLARVTSAVPFTWTPADADILVINGIYQAA